ncbi:MAG: putative signal transduction histidine kinase [Frankiales bacterium]|nr:putative signal transduction histidine kinase [Frankiales bacterium]
MSTLGDLVRARTSLAEADVDWLHRLVGEWQLVADLAFADLVLHVRTTDGSWLAVAHLRPTTGPTTYPHDVVGSEQASAPTFDRAVASGHIVTEGSPDWRARVPVRQDVIPVRRGEGVPAVITRETNLNAARMPSALELTYLTTAGELLQMISEGRFPFPGPVPDPEHAPRVGDGLLRLDRTGHVVYASPNALSAYRRLGVTGDLLGAHLGSTIARLSAAPGVLDEPRGSAALAAVLRFGEPRESEVEARGETVLLRALPLHPGGEPRGALLLVRDVTELRRRDRQLQGKDATIREIHHRVKNNLQTVAALLRMQARRMDAAPARAALEQSVRRVASIALVHETLSQAWEDNVDFDEIADRVIAMCAEVAVPESAVQVRRVGSFGVLPADVATALSMVLNELVQNAVEHGYPGSSAHQPPTPTGQVEGAGLIEVQVQRGEDRLTVTVTDDGVGLPDGFDPAATGRLGLQIARTLVTADLRGSLTLEPSGASGARAVVDLPLPPALSPDPG